MDASYVFREGLLAGKTAVVTGGASGIGRGIAAQLARAGAGVAIASRRADQCKTAAEELSAEYGVAAAGIGMDVRDSAGVNAAMAEIAARFGGIDLLVNNAAGNFYYPARQLSDNQWKAVVEIDLYGTFYCCREAFPYLKEAGGSVISISMTLHRSGWAGMAPACAAKSGIDALTRTLALEWAPHGIRVNAIAPGPIVTEGVKKAFGPGGDFSAMEDSIPLGRTGAPEEIGGLAVFMASPAAAWMTGEIVTLDGGESLSPRRPGIDPAALDQLPDMMRKGAT